MGCIFLTLDKNCLIIDIVSYVQNISVLSMTLYKKNSQPLGGGFPPLSSGHATGQRERNKFNRNHTEPGIDSLTEPQRTVHYTVGVSSSKVWKRSKQSLVY